MNDLVATKDFLSEELSRNATNNLVPTKDVIPEHQDNDYGNDDSMFIEEENIFETPHK